MHAISAVRQPRELTSNPPRGYRPFSEHWFNQSEHRNKIIICLLRWHFYLHHKGPLRETEKPAVRLLSSQPFSATLNIHPREFFSESFLVSRHAASPQ